MFPAGFHWGTATAAHQVEGWNFNNQWWDWEQQPGRIKDGSRSHPGTRQYDRFRDDFKLLKDLHQNAHRISIEWSRVVPTAGRVDTRALRHYREVLEALRSEGIEPYVTLHHFSQPLWFERIGGFTKAANRHHFLAFVRRIVEEFRDLVTFWITINEPGVYANLAFNEGIHPPGERNIILAATVLRNLLATHAQAYDLIHELQPDAQVGISHNVAAIEPIAPSAPNRAAAWLHSRILNHGVLGGIDGSPLALATLPFLPPRRPQKLDFLGINYYSRSLVRFRPNPATLFAQHSRGSLPRTLFEWEIYPDGFRQELLNAARFGVPIVVTENGCADENDEIRPAYLRSHLAAMHDAIQAGADIRGYLHWTAFDNFEWAEGLRMRFGLVHVDFNTGERTVKPSGRIYAEICRTNTLAE